MHTDQPLKILLADAEYTQYLLLKRLFAENHRCRTHLYWCGERDQYTHAILTGIYDLALIEYNVDSLEALDYVELGNGHTPVVLMTDKISEDLFVRANACGVRGYVSRRAPDKKRLDSYLSFALWHRRQAITLKMITSANLDRAVGSLRLQ